MTQDELSLEAYVVLGNALNLLVNGLKAEDQQRLALPIGDLRRLHNELEPVRANDMLHSITQLPERDRTLLGEALRLCERLAGTGAESLLGAPADVRSAVLQLLLEAGVGDEA